MIKYLIVKLMITFSAFATSISIVGYMISANSEPPNQTGTTIFLVLGIISALVFITVITLKLLEKPKDND